MSNNNSYFARAIRVDGKSVIKPLKDGTSIELSYTFIRENIPEFEGKSDEEIHKILGGLSQEELHDIFAGGVYVNCNTDPIARETERLEAEKKAREEALGKAREEARQKDQIENEKQGKKKRWIIPHVIVLGGLSLAGLVRGCSSRSDKDNIPDLPPSDPEVKVMEDKEEPDGDRIVTQRRSYEFILYRPNDSTQYEKANTDYGDQEAESNARTESSEMDTSYLEDAENLALENFAENQEAIEKMNDGIAILQSSTANNNEKMDALSDMGGPAITIAQNYDSSKMAGITEEAVSQSQKHPDEVTTQEVQNAENLEDEYAVQKECQDSNVSSLLYIQYLKDNGFEITSINVEEPNLRGDMAVSINVSRDVEQSKSEVGVVSPEDFQKALEQYIENGGNPNDFLKQFEENDRTERDNASVVSISDGVSTIISFGRDDFKEVARSRTPEQVTDSIEEITGNREGNNKEGNNREDNNKEGDEIGE